MQCSLIDGLHVHCIPGMVLTVRIVWPEFGDELLQQMIREHPDDLWRVDVFPNFVTFRRQIEALKTVCIRGYLEPKPMDLVRQILTSLITDQVKRRRVQDESVETDEAGSKHDEPDADQPESAADVLPRPPAENVRTNSSNLSLPSDVVTDEAAPDEEEVLPDVPSVGNVDVANSHQQLQQKRWSKEEDSASFHTLKCRDRPYKRIPSNLNESQRRAVEAAVNGPLTVIQGPPGTGKTKTAAAIVKEWLSVDRYPTVIIS